MERVRRSKPVSEGLEAPSDAEEVEGTGEEAADLLNEPSYVRVEGESAQEAQDRIEEKYRSRATSPLRAIRAFCVLCMGAQPREVANCTATTCVMYKFRFGRNPYQKRG